MALGELTKQLAAEALKAAAPGPAAPAQPENLQAALLGQVQAMQRALKEDEELVVLFHSGGEAIRVLEFYSPTSQVVVLKGTDPARNPTRVVATSESLQLICKVMKVPAPGKPVRLGFLVPKPRPE